MHSFLFFSLYNILLLFILVNGDQNLQCRDENGNPVDWLAIYKLPKNSKSNNQFIKKGTAYLYVTSDSLTDGLHLSQLPITDNRSIPSRILSPVTEQQNSIQDDLFYIAYSDQPPNGSTVSSSYGHSKGVVIGNNEGGLWLVHSVPNFPFFDEGSYEYPVTGVKYGQSFLCISLDKRNLDYVGDQLSCNNAFIYDKKFGTEFENIYPELYEATMGVKSQSMFHQVPLTSLGNQTFISFAKSSLFNGDLYKAVANNLTSELYVETWIHGGSVIPTDCWDPYPVHNIREIKIANLHFSFSSMNDHSKFAISAIGNLVCIGDINHAESQMKRGGGTVCILNKILWQLYYNTVGQIDACPEKASKQKKTKKVQKRRSSRDRRDRRHKKRCPKNLNNFKNRKN